MRNCGRCHTCGGPIKLVLDGEEWCPSCKQYQRPVSHGWPRVAVASKSTCGHALADTIPCEEVLKTKGREE